MENQYKKKWEALIKNDYFPNYLRKIQTFDLKKFNEIVLKDPEKTKTLIKNMFLGDALIVRNVFEKKILNKLKSQIYNSGNDNEEAKENLKILENCPNFHKSNKLEDLPSNLDNYVETAHSYFFFRWNSDNLKIFEYFDKFWETIKIICGLNKNEYKNNTPKNLIVDRIQVLRYPLNEGYISPHCDVAAWQKLNIGVCLSEKGIDFDSGGLYLLDKNENKINVETHMKVGDCICWIPTIFHGVDIPKTKDQKKYEWNSDKGRWQAIALTVQSHYVKERILSVGHKKFKENPEKYKKIYRNAYSKYSD